MSDKIFWQSPGRRLYALFHDGAETPDAETLRYYENVAARFVDGEPVLRDGLTEPEWHRMSWIAGDMIGHLAPVFFAHGAGRPHGLSEWEIARLVVWWLGTIEPSRLWSSACRFYDNPGVSKND